ncbi:MAG: xanthine dehydrogenase family protein subunit M [Spirochaetaceae bacterium]|nr:MAG: xanthine dehydrogenase family protein subunit M [Spirochaetaceae bacterium]
MSATGILPPAPTWSFARPATPAEAVALLSGGAAVVHAGGTDLMVRIKEGRVPPRLVVDLGSIGEWRHVESAGDTVVIGAACPIADIERDPLIGRRYPGLVDAIRVVGSVQIRNRATLGGNIANASPAADTLPPLVALGALARVLGPSGERTVSVATLVTGPGRTTLAPDEVITAIVLPHNGTQDGSAYLRLTRRNSVDLALTSVAVALRRGGEAEGERATAIAFGSVGPRIVRATAVEEALGPGPPFNPNAVDRAAAVASQSVSPITDVRASERYRRAMCAVLFRRCLALAVERGGS